MPVEYFEGVSVNMMEGFDIGRERYSSNVLDGLEAAVAGDVKEHLGMSYVCVMNAQCSDVRECMHQCSIGIKGASGNRLENIELAKK